LKWPRAFARRAAREEAREEGEAEAPPAGSCSPPLPALPPRGNDDNDADGPPVAYGILAEAAAFEVAALIVM
jgi:hypothetical protein